MALTPAQRALIARNVLAQVNRLRAKHGRRALVRSPALDRCAALHNNRMAAAGVLDHQFPGEPSLGRRVTGVGVRWSWCGENLGASGDISNAGALALIAQMYAERPPADGHRRIMLDARARATGVAIAEGHGKLWLTQTVVATV